ncbi:ABC transporter substrate-binding protein [Limibaculum sp. FT325]|uniref:ABC transporter substrate-binding protein n=1 Tax=Thermohalobaculum sediminis TaxID=2939436 RepID=UPI0020C0F998|nr:ABC transporter substrate-binding protein [Limibaculum sediminis]MCL5775922.1 ABC transporter substrate-binding protein [Limibaculum sediminis]
MKRLVTAMMLGTAALALAAPASAETLRWAAAGDSLTLDPHAQNEGPTHTMSHQVYETLLHRDMAGKIVPSLATEWAPTDDPNKWEFKLRPGVKFHDGADFTASDVVFSLKRAMLPDSDMKELLASVSDVVAVDDLTVQIVTNGPNPILPSNLTNLFILDEGWAKANGVEKPQDFEGGEETFAVRNANGTGAFMLVERAPDSKTVLKRNPNHWGKDQFSQDVTEIVFTPIQNAATRVAALLSGEVDFIQDVPVQDLGRVEAADGLVVRTAPQNRVIFFGMNVGDADLKTDNIEGKNPFADPRVREAMNMAINRDAIRQVVMRGQSQPAGVIMPPFVNGWTPELDAVPATDVAKAKALMAEAGYGDGFSVTLNCPNDRYINDEAICQAAVGMMGQIGIKVALDAKPKAQHFPLIGGYETDFYMLGWGVPTFDSEYIFNFLVHTKGEKYGSWNGTRYSNPELDAKIESLASETDLAKRDATIAEIWQVVQAETIYLPIHHQVLNWGMKSAIDFPVQPEDQPHFKYLTFKK